MFFYHKTSVQFNVLKRKIGLQFVLVKCSVAFVSRGGVSAQSTGTKANASRTYKAQNMKEAPLKATLT